MKRPSTIAAAALVASMFVTLSSSHVIAAGQRLKVGGQVKAPIQVVKVNPIYPKDAQDGGIQGVVILDIVVGEDGSVIDTEVVRSVPELDQAAIDAVIQWKYEPTLLNGEPVEIEFAVTINFTLS
jgi:protein TonB